MKQKSLFFQRYKNGKSVASITESAGIPRSSVYSWIRSFSYFVSKLQRVLKNLENPHKYWGEKKYSIVLRTLGYRFKWCLQFAL